jgi:type II secretory pathway predicted ATPase ExeA
MLCHNYSVIRYALHKWGYTLATMNNKITSEALRSRQYRRAYEDICSSLVYGESVVKLTGIKDTGKSVISQLVCRHMEELNHHVIVIDNHPATPVDLQNEIIQQLSTNTKGSFQKVFDYHLQTLAAARHFLLIIVEDAHQLDEQTLASLHTLFEVRNSPEPLIKIMLVGQPELNDLLQKPRCKSLTQRMSRSFNLRNMDRAEVREFANNFIRERCGASIHFSSSAIRLITLISNGLPKYVLELSQQCQPEKINKALHATISRERLVEGIKNLPSDHYLYKRFQWLRLRLHLIIVALTLVLMLPLLYLQKEATENIPVPPLPANSTVDLHTTMPEKVVAKRTRPPESADEESTDISDNVSLPNNEPASSTSVQSTQANLQNQITDIEAYSTNIPSEAEAGEITLDSELNKLLKIWADAWQSKDFATYFAHYSPGYSPNQATTHEQWLAQRRERISARKDIKIEVEPATIVAQEANRITIHFLLNYQSSSYSDTTKKQMILANSNGRWLIEQERSLVIYY